VCREAKRVRRVKRVKRVNGGEEVEGCEESSTWFGVRRVIRVKRGEESGEKHRVKESYCGGAKRVIRVKRKWRERSQRKEVKRDTSAS
jgi:hypothetical protein